MKSKKNIQFLILQAIGIILVVVGHKGGIVLLTDWFPEYSFHMPLFMFISGYFYKSSNSKELSKFVIKKVKSLLVPYFIWNFIYGIIFMVFTNYKLIDFAALGARKLSFKSLFIDPWVDGHQFIFNLAAWFVLTLFLVQLIYALYKKVSGLVGYENEYFNMILFLIVGVYGVFLANKGYNIGYYLPIIKIMFCIPFYHMGYLYKEKLECKDNLSNIVYFMMLFVIQYVLLKKYNSLGFSVAWATGFNRQNIFLPFITSITGILFWLRISRILIKSLQESKIVQYIGSHTWDIMIHHIFVIFMMNLCLSILSPYIGLNSFNHELFRSSIWYSYEPNNTKNINLFYCIVGISIPLLLRYGVSTTFNHYKLRKVVDV